MGVAGLRWVLCFFSMQRVERPILRWVRETTTPPLLLKSISLRPPDIPAVWLTAARWNISRRHRKRCCKSLGVRGVCVWLWLRSERNSLIRRKVDLQRPIHLPYLASVFVFFGGEKLLPFFSLLIFLLTLKIKASARAERNRITERGESAWIIYKVLFHAASAAEFIAFYYEPAQWRYTKKLASAPARINNSSRWQSLLKFACTVAEG